MKKINPDKRKKNIALNDMSKLIVQAIESEPFLNKDVLIPKIKAILSSFHVNTNLIRFGEIREPSEVDKILKSALVARFDCVFFKNKLKDIVGDEKMKIFYAELHSKRPSNELPSSEQNPERSVATEAE